MPAFDQDELTGSREEGGGLQDLPTFQTGGRVERTGIALVHQGEYIVPAPGSEAMVSPVEGAALDGQVINYYFPVEIEVVGELSDADLQRVAQYVFEELETAIRTQI